MGKPQSKTAVSGDSNVNIINQLEQHSEFHDDHNLKLWIIIVFNIAQVLFAIYKWNNKRVKRKAFKKGCMSTNNLDKI